jgi:hypothetical protein
MIGQQTGKPAPQSAPAGSQPKKGLNKSNVMEIERQIGGMVESGRMTKEAARTQLKRLDKEGIEAPELRDRLTSIATDRPLRQGLARVKAEAPARTLEDISKLASGRISKATAETQMKRLNAIWNELGPTNTEKFAVMDRLNKIIKQGQGGASVAGLQRARS